MIVHPDFFDHWKTKAVIKKLKDPAAPIYVQRLWAHCQKMRTSQFAMSDDALKWICDFPGEGSALREAMKTCRFILQNPDEPTGFTVHQWEQHNASLINSWVNGQKGGRCKEPTGYPPAAQTNPPKSNSNSLRVQNKKKVDNPRVSESEPTLSVEETQKRRQEVAQLFRKTREQFGV